MSTFKKTFVVFFFLLVTVNVYFSQRYSTSLYKIILDKDKLSSLKLLTTLTKSSEFSQQVLFLSEYIGVDYVEYFQRDSSLKQARIAEIESILLQNPRNPQVLYLLSQEYHSVGEDKYARSLRQQAHELDPLNY